MSQNEPVTYTRLSNNAESISRIKELNKLFASAFEDKTTYLGNKPSDDYLKSLLSKEHIIVCVAIIDEKIVGGLVAYVMDKCEQERSEVYIYDLAVDSQHLRQRIATNLIYFLKQEALKSGAWIAFIQADPVDSPAVNLYDTLGKREEVYHFDLLLDD
ncbi:MAG: GNAT family N-acetyltransferase [Alkalibacterium sp.]|nr:GNAT family N-acetyltransferase [Alkalibacterium sp.]